MMRELSLALGVAVVLADAAGAVGSQAPNVYGRFKPKVGSWAEYHYSKAKKSNAEGTYRIAVVGKDGGDFWIETKFTTTKTQGPAGQLIGKTLIGKDDPFTPKRVLMLMGNKVIEATPKKSSKHKMPDIKDAGSEKITVPAGAFSTDVLAYKGDKNSAGKVWVKDGIGPWGLVRMQDDGGAQMELTSYGSDAKPEVDESKAEKMSLGAMFGAGANQGGSSGSTDSSSSAGSSASSAVGNALQNSLFNRLHK